MENTYLKDYYLIKEQYPLEDNFHQQMQELFAMRKINPNNKKQVAAIRQRVLSALEAGNNFFAGEGRAIKPHDSESGLQNEYWVTTFERAIQIVKGERGINGGSRPLQQAMKWMVDWNLEQIKKFDEEKIPPWERKQLEEEQIRTRQYPVEDKSGKVEMVAFDELSRHENIVQRMRNTTLAVQALVEVKAGDWVRQPRAGNMAV